MTFSEADKKLNELNALGSRLGLDTMRELCRRLGDPQDKIKTVHVAGTNGKGSTIAYLDSIARAAGQRSGAYTSPCLEYWRENIRINGEWITEEDSAEFLTRIFIACDQMVADGFNRPTRFEVETALAFLYFKESACDIAFIETGLGGRDDATNILKKPAVTVLTSISLDHTQILGDTVEKIAEIKCGIIKENVPCVTAAQETEVLSVIEKNCFEKNAPLTVAVRYVYSVATWVAFLLGFSDSHMKTGIANTKWFGRVTTVCDKPIFIVDGAHNPAGVEFLMNCVDHEGNARNKLIFIIGFFRDKDCEGMLKILALHTKKIITNDMPENKRLLRAEELKAIANKYHNDVTASTSPADAVKRAFEAAGKKGVIVSFGSLSTIAAVTKAVKEYTKNG